MDSNEKPHKNTQKSGWVSAFQNLVMIAQLGLNMAVPLFLCVIAAAFIQRKFGAGSWVIVVGAVLGVVLAFNQFSYFVKNAMRQTKGGEKGE